MRLRKLLPLIPDAAASVIRVETDDAIVAQISRAIVRKYDGQEVSIDKDSKIGLLWIAISAQIDMQIAEHAAINAKRAEAGRAGGLAKAANADQAKDAPKSEMPKQPLPVEDKPKTVKKFVKPTVEEVRAYCDQNNINIDAQQFCDFYESKGWVVGKAPMKNWHAACRTWTRNGLTPNSYLEPTQQEKDKYGNLFG